MLRGRVIVTLLVGALGVAACSGSDDGAPSSTTSVIDESIDAAANAPDGDFDPQVVDDALVPITVDEVVLDDDVIIATDDGQIPTTTEAVVESAPTTEPVATTAPPQPVPTPAPSSITRVVSLSPTHTDTLAAIGAADLLVGVDPFSDPPAGASIETDQLLPDDLDVEVLRSLDVDLVVLGDDVRGVAAAVLSESGIPFFDGAPPTTRAGVEAQVLALAAAVDRAEAGQTLVASMRDEVDAIIASLPGGGDLTYFHELDPGLATYTPGTLVDSLYRELGLRSVVPEEDAIAVLFPAPDLLAADPDVIVLGDIECCAASAERAGARPGWAELSAVRNGAIVEVPDDIANRFGVNVVELMRRVAVGVAAAS